MKLFERLFKNRRQKGFTLIEVLIVVVIIGVLAALVIPRFVAAPEKAMVAEANQMLGSLIRAQNAKLDTGTAFIGAGSLTSANWNSLGLVVPASASKFTYACTSPSCSATRTVGSTLSSAVLSTATGAFACSGSYSSLSNGGCSVT